VADQTLEIIVAGQDFTALRRALFATVAGHYLESESSTARQSDQENYKVFALNALLARLPTRSLASVATIAKGKTGIKDAVPGPFPLVVTAEARSSSDHFDFEGPGVIIPMVSSTGHGDASLKRVHFQDGHYAVGSILAAVQPKDTQQLSARYLHAYLSTFKDELLVSRMVGTANVSLTVAKIGDVPVPLLPISVQRKVDKLMVLCDRLEAQHADAESAHAQLVQALLDSLTQASDATDFDTSWQRLAEHFHTLFTTESSIDALKQTMLQLAVMGKLVPQDPNDEPANELLKQIAEEKARLVAKGKIKKQKPIAMLSEKEQAFGIPARWSWARLGDLSVLITSGSRGWNEYYSDSGSTFIRSQDIKTDKLKFDNRAFVCLPKSAEGIRTRVELGDLLITITGANVAKAAMVEDSLDDAYVSQHVALIRLANRSFGVFIHKWLTNSHGGRALLLENSYGAKPGLNLNNIRDLPVPVPPINEQHRIVAKVDQLMAICDQLKTRLTQARQLNEQLANTLVEQALAEDGQQTPLATDRQAARTLLAAEITHRLHSQRTFGQRKLQKVIYLAEHAARLAAIQGDYLRDAAGPHDRQLMNNVEGEMQDLQWYERIERDTVGHAYRPLSQAGQHRQEYCSAWPVSERATIEQVIELMRDWDTDRCEMTVTLYAAWNDFILEGRPVSDEAIVDEVMHSWNDTKLRFGKTEWLAVLAEMKKHKILMPSGFGKRTSGGMLSLPGFE
jgi:type I restriction enzyme S subunit